MGFLIFGVNAVLADLARAGTGGDVFNTGLDVSVDNPGLPVLIALRLRSGARSGGAPDD